MRKVISLCMAALLCLSIFAGCGEKPAEPAATPAPAPAETPEPTPEPQPYRFTRETMPRMDGSTSLVPLAQAAAGILLGEAPADVEDLTRFNRTTTSYSNLMHEHCDILIASWPAESVFRDMKNYAFEYEMQPIATDALIFVVNENNPVEDLSTEEIVGIYTGEITNWSQVGGRDEAILPFQRNAGAGSQALMEKLVMGDTAMMEAPTDLVATGMGELMECVKGYDNSANAIGYSVFYYANDMRMAEGLKIISVDGVEPTADTIRAGDYPHLSNYYTVIAADAAADSPERIMFDWLQGAEGQRLVEHMGYVPVMDTSAAPEKEPVSAGYLVETDWAALSFEATPEAKYTRLSEDFIDGLAPQDDYGALYPFVGVNNYFHSQVSPVYGLFDESGRIVCDAVYSSVESCRWYDGGFPRSVPMLQLGRTVDGVTEYTLATPDGSFVSPESYRFVKIFDFGVLCARDHESTEFHVYDFEGNVLLTEADLKLGTRTLGSVADIIGGSDGGILIRLTEEGKEEATVWLFNSKGERLGGGWKDARYVTEGFIEITVERSDGEDSKSKKPTVGIVNSKGEWVVHANYERISLIKDGFVAHRAEGSDGVFNYKGGSVAAYAEVEAIGPAFSNGEKFFTVSGSRFEADEWVTTSFLGTVPVLALRTEEGVSLVNVEEPKEILELPGYIMAEQLSFNYIMGEPSGLEYIAVWGAEDMPALLVSWDLKNSYELPGIMMPEVIRDGYTGEEYISSGYMGELYTADMELYAGAGTWTSIWNGKLCLTDEFFCTYTTTGGEVLFRYPIMADGD